MSSQQLQTSLRGLPIDNSSVEELISLIDSPAGSTVTIVDVGAYTNETTVEGALQEIYAQISGVSPASVQIDPTLEDALALRIGTTFQIRRYYEIRPLVTSGPTTATGLGEAGPILSAAIRVSTAITGLDSADHHIQLGVAGTTDKYIDVANGSSDTSIAVNTKGNYVGFGADGAEPNELILTITGGSDQTPTAGAVELEVIYLDPTDFADA